MKNPSERITAMAEAVLKEAKARGFSLATAESCTGGLLAALLTDVENYSHVFERGFVTYAEQSKCDLLGVSPDLIAREGVVSEAVARAMASGALARTPAELCAAITGYAGSAPDGGEDGLVHIAVARREGLVLHERCLFPCASRDEVRAGAIEHALALMHCAITA